MTSKSPLKLRIFFHHKILLKKKDSVRVKRQGHIGEKIFATNTSNEVFRPGDIRTPTNPYEKEGNTVEK